MYVYGGLLASQQCSASLHVLDTTSWVWRDLGVFSVDGAPIKACGLAVVVAADQMILFGGVDTASGTTYDQFFLYDLALNKWHRDPEHRNSRFCGVMSTFQDEGGQVLFIWGGYDLINGAMPKFADQVLLSEVLGNKEPLN
jgi:hypothetical protein